MSADDEEDMDTIVTLFDRLCFAFGDEDAIVPAPADADAEPGDNASTSSSGASMSYFELQEYSKNLAFQLQWRFQPDYVLVDCKRIPGAEAVATMACMRIQCPFVPVSCADQHRPGRLNVVVDHLREKGKRRGSKDDAPAVVAITVCENDLDPILSVFQQANVHQIIYLDETGGIREQIQVPDYLPTILDQSCAQREDDLMVLFTSGTTGGSPKAVVGSHAATLRRIQWFHQNFDSSARVVRKTALTFVDGITELWCTLLDRDSVLVTISPTTLQAEGLAAILRAEPSQLLLLPSQLGQLLLLPKCETLQRLIISGEQASRVSVERVYSQYPDIQLINLYGQTETSGDVICAILSDMDNSKAFHDDIVAVGKPIGDTIIRISDEQEFVILGSQLSNGYLGQQQQGQCFDSFATGDLGFCENGIYYVKGRKDDVVKLHGIWTCPTEIETAFCRLYQTQEALACFVLDEAYMLCPKHNACERFSREDMHHRGKLPWNLIPKAVFCHEIPTSQSSGAGKTSRRDARNIVEQLLVQSSQPTLSTIKPTLSSILCETLNLPGNELDTHKSFVELGGNSAKAITVLYQLRQVFPTATYLTAVDLLINESIKDLDLVLAGEKAIPRKKRRIAAQTETNAINVVPRPPIRHSDNHTSLELMACVDSKPLFVGGLIYAACQGGAILMFTPSGSIEGSRRLTGWMIQADIVATEDLLIVCAYKRNLDAGLVIALSLDLKEEVWRVALDLPVKATPLFVDDSMLWVAVGTVEHTSVCRISTKTGKVFGSRICLPFPSISKPVLLSNHKIIYGCSSWEGGIFAVDTEGKVQHLFEGEIGPVIGRDLVTLPDGHVLVSDGYGALHVIDPRLMVMRTIRLGSMPLTTPLILDDRTCVVGSNDGNVYAVDMTTDKVLWSCECRASILGRPGVYLEKEGSILVRTTTGQLIVVDRDGNITWERRMIEGEIWGDAEEVQSQNAGTSVAFGARDGRVHIVSRPLH
jgi:acyl-coenzyme A synthetase/AMP-(fatty) acid ligase